MLMPGINVRKPALELSDEEWQRVVDLNLTAMFRAARELGHVMVQQRSGSVSTCCRHHRDCMAHDRSRTRHTLFGNPRF
jgi:NAD(P)-dependent dehydrogenase (short-subunit alcohol dehydrogenase family)